ncbi:MAG: bifunctional 2-C-methyl-D-erythritol 4-phosphate cytidylyltransferase/2-C-methyl-D-erythritol 2,4-cyclodiphosphate synthase [Pseudomonadota bacterium]
MKIGVVIVAAGSGKRAGKGPRKQERLIAGRPILAWSLQTFLSHPHVASVALVVPQDLVKADSGVDDPRVTRVAGGDSRTQSVKNGLAALSMHADDMVMIHDVARPGLEIATIDALIAALDSADAAAPALPVADALKRVDGEALQSVSRDALYRVQTPQAFRFGQISEALSNTDDSLVDDLSAVEAMDRRVHLVAGSERLAKITYPEDFERMERILGGQINAPRMGTGFDVHAFETGNHVTLCGVKIDHTSGLKGHSDADVGWHALTDAILGACALGDIGDHFPPSDPKWANADSELFLKHAVTLATEAGYIISNCDITIICEAPKVKPHREAMRARTAQVLDVDINQISIKATTTEQLGFTGRREGIAAQASAVLSQRA